MIKFDIIFFIIKTIIIVLLLSSITTTNSTIIANQVLCSFSDQSISVQSTYPTITCSISNYGLTYNYSNRPATIISATPAVCFDLHGEKCKLDKNSRYCTIPSTKYLSCVGENVLCTTGSSTCENRNSLYYVNGVVFAKSEFDSSINGNNHNSSYSNRILPLTILNIILIIFIISISI